MSSSGTTDHGTGLKGYRLLQRKQWKDDTKVHGSRYVVALKVRFLSGYKKNIPKLLPVAPRAPPLHFSRDGQFKIMQVADLHYSVSAGVCRDTVLDPCTHSDNLTNSLLAHVLDNEKPDMVVFTGDQLNGQGTSWDPRSVLAKFANAVTDRQIPWAAIFGNHDSETGLGREDQMALLQGMPYSLTQRGPKDIHGVGNYVLKVYSADPYVSNLSI